MRCQSCRPSVAVPADVSKNRLHQHPSFLTVSRAADLGTSACGSCGTSAGLGALLLCIAIHQSYGPCLSLPVDPLPSACLQLNIFAGTRRRRRRRSTFRSGVTLGLAIVHTAHLEAHAAGSYSTNISNKLSCIAAEDKHQISSTTCNGGNKTNVAEWHHQVRCKSHLTCKTERQPCVRNLGYSQYRTE